MEAMREDEIEEEKKDQNENTNSQPLVIPATDSPSLAEVIQAGLEIGCSEKECTRFWHHFEAMGWHNKHGQPIRHWPSKLASWRIDGGREPHGNHQTRTDRTTHRDNKREREYDHPLQSPPTIPFTG